MASVTSLSGYVLSMTGVTLPASMSSLSTTRSSPFAFATNVPSFWLTNGDSRRSPTDLVWLEAAPGDDHRRPEGAAGTRAGRAIQRQDADPRRPNRLPA